MGTGVGQSTIYALATGNERSAIGVIRISGPQAKDIVHSLIGVPPTRSEDDGEGKGKGKGLKDRELVMRKLVDPATKGVLDVGMVTVFTSPSSYTGEDMGELHIHGGQGVVSSVLSALSSMGPHVRMAVPGEFTRRAMAGGKMDLVQVEGLADLLAASSPTQTHAALSALLGSHSETYHAWTDAVVRTLAMAEAMVDFGEDEGLDSDAFAAAMDVLAGSANHKGDRGVVGEMAAAVEGARTGMALREGVSVVLGGVPNVGKSSLLNVLAGRDAAIVHDAPGTTRDAVQISLSLGGYPVVMTDTAGVRPDVDADSPIEVEGIRRSRRAWQDAGIRVLMGDSGESLGVGSAALAGGGGGAAPPDLVLCSKSDLRRRHPFTSEDEKEKEVIEMSCKSGEGIAEVERALTEAVVKYFESGGVSGGERDGGGDGGGGSGGGEEVVVTRVRVRQALEEAIAAIEEANGRRDDVELAATALRDAVASLGRVTGAVDVESVLDVVFSEFCIGK